MADQDTPSRRRRRDHSPELKRDLVQQCMLPGASVSAPLLLPITLTSAPSCDTAAPPPPVPTPCGTRTAGSIELDFAGARLRLHGAVDPQSLVALLTALRSLT